MAPSSRKKYTCKQQSKCPQKMSTHNVTQNCNVNMVLNLNDMSSTVFRWRKLEISTMLEVEEDRDNLYQQS